MTITATVGDRGAFGGPATWSVTNPCDGETLDIDITPLTSDGFWASDIHLEFVQGGTQFGSRHYTWLDRNARDSVYGNVLSGITKQTTVSTSSLNFSQPFRMYYSGQLIFEFR